MSFAHLHTLRIGTSSADIKLCTDGVRYEVCTLNTDVQELTTDKSPLIPEYIPYLYIYRSYICTTCHMYIPTGERSTNLVPLPPLPVTLPYLTQGRFIVKHKPNISVSPFLLRTAYPAHSCVPQV